MAWFIIVFGALAADRKMASPRLPVVSMLREDALGDADL
jgi:hypothetical protein